MNQLGTIVNYVCIVPWIRTTREISLSALSAARSDGRAQWLLYISRLGRGGDRKKQGADMMCCSFTCVLSIHLFICFLWGWLGDFLWLFMLRKMKSRLLTCSLRYGEACSNENLQFNWKYWLIYGDAFRCLDKVWPTHFQVGAPARSCSWSPVGGQGSSCFCVASCPSSLLPHTVQHQNLVPGVPVTADSAPPRPQLDLCPEVFLHPPKLFDLNTQMQPLEIKETGWRSFRCVSSHPGVSVDTWASCWDLIAQLLHPAHSCQPHTCIHACTHGKTVQLTNKSRWIAAFLTTALTLVSGLAQQGLFVLQGKKEKQHFT